MSLKDRTAANACDINGKAGWAVTQTKQKVGSRLCRGGFTQQRWGSDREGGLREQRRDSIRRGGSGCKGVHTEKRGFRRQRRRVRQQQRGVTQKGVRQQRGSGRREFRQKRGGSGSRGGSGRRGSGSRRWDSGRRGNWGRGGSRVEGGLARRRVQQQKAPAEEGVGKRRSGS